MKKIISLLLIFVLCISAAVTASAEGKLPSYTFKLVEDGQGNATLYVISPADTTVNSGTVIFSYDKAVMTYLGSECAFFGEANPNYNRDGIEGIAFNFASTIDIPAGSVLFTAIFKLAENATPDVEDVVPEKWTMADGDAVIADSKAEDATVEKLQYCIVTVVDTEGKFIADVEVEKGTSELISPTVDGYSFVKWIDKPAVFNECVTVTAEYKPAYVLGDINADGNINAADASLVLQYDVKLTKFDETKLAAAEVSGDKAVTAMDAALILQYNVKLITKFPADK